MMERPGGRASTLSGGNENENEYGYSHPVTHAHCDDHRTGNQIGRPSYHSEARTTIGGTSLLLFSGSATMVARGKASYTPADIATVSKEKERCPAFHVAEEQMPIF